MCKYGCERIFEQAPFLQNNYSEAFFYFGDEFCVSVDLKQETCGIQRTKVKNCIKFANKKFEIEEKGVFLGKMCISHV